MHKNYVDITKIIITKPSKDMFIIPKFFSTEKFNDISNTISEYYEKYNVRNDNFIRKGGSFSHHQMLTTPLEKINNILNSKICWVFFDSLEFLDT